MASSCRRMMFPVQRELRRNRQEDFESSVPLKVWRREVLIAMGIVAGDTNLVREKAARRLRHLVVRHNWIVGFSETLLVNEGEMAYVKEPFHLPIHSGLDLHAVETYLQVIRVIPFL